MHPLIGNRYFKGDRNVDHPLQSRCEQVRPNFDEMCVGYYLKGGFWKLKHVAQKIWQEIQHSIRMNSTLLLPQFAKLWQALPFAIVGDVIGFQTVNYPQK